MVGGQPDGQSGAAWPRHLNSYKIYNMKETFRKLAHWSAEVIGSPTAFVLSCLGVVVWAVYGPYYGYSDTWQLIINTGTTVLTFLMLFLVQNTQNRDAKAIHLKLDELIRSAGKARNQLLDLEDMSDAELDVLQAEFEKLRNKTLRS